MDKRKVILLSCLLLFIAAVISTLVIAKIREGNATSKATVLTAKNANTQTEKNIATPTPTIAVKKSSIHSLTPTPAIAASNTSSGNTPAASSQETSTGSINNTQGASSTASTPTPAANNIGTSTSTPTPSPVTSNDVNVPANTQNNSAQFPCDNAGRGGELRISGNGSNGTNEIDPCQSGSAPTPPPVGNTVSVNVVKNPGATSENTVTLE